MTTWSRRRSGENRQRLAKPYCKCFDDGNKEFKVTTSLDANGNKPTTLDKLSGCKIYGCSCGEHANVSEWQWETPTHTDSSWVMMTWDQKQVTFHPFHSSGTAMVKGDTPLQHDYHYYWEIKMLTEPYGTDIMVGLGTDKVDSVTSRYRFTSLLGQDAESYGLSYTGAIRHNDMVTRDGAGFCKGSIIGVKVDLWQGTLEFFLNREPKGISFYNLRRHPTQTLFPMVCSTAAQSSMRLIYADSWQASLLVDAAKILGSTVNGDLPLPPGLKNKMKTQFWLTLPNDSYVRDDRSKRARIAVEEGEEQDKPAANYILRDDFPFTFNEYYTDSVAENYRIAIVFEGIDNNQDHNYL